MRLEKFREVMAKENLDGFLITQPENRRYLSGFTGSAGLLIITKEKQVLATDFRYYEQVRQQCPEWELFEIKREFSQDILELLRSLELGARRVGFEAKHISVATLHSWERALLGRLVLVHTEDYVEEMRMQKDETEIAAIKKAVALTDEAFNHITNWIRPGMTELQVAWELESYMRTHGAERVSFEVIVAAGPNSAKPHARPSEQVLQAGEPIIMDLGCVVDGYCSDMTRTICLGEPADERYQAIWNTVLRAQQAALKGAKAGLTGEAADKLARDIIIEAGYGDNFGHGLGHSLGLFIHEGPRYSPSYPHAVPANVMMTIEPGIYIPGWGGVRIEDLTVVREEGLEILTRSPKQAVLPLL
jgi:Xaa-Pro aminopeptidase